MTKILIPIDGSDCAEKTLEWAMKTFDKSQTEYYLYYVIKLLPDIPQEAFEVEEAIKVLKSTQAKLESAGCKVVKAEYTTGEPSDLICSYADEMDVDEVLIGSHGRKGIAKFLLGSVSTAVLERCNKPVFVYRNVERQPLHVNTKIML